ncbi:hypothetical protein [Streptomyces sp. RerS4]|uniref:hypothetical protein n=1 Tax=Streptomyces sp. RerS4 TaxID=2942449 RepID=UPI00201C7D0D|nr:hypothetical protein [Streptomyces sp. RerS4]UQX02431.1 hypothetical protein M4D82_19500 [Streptomyces sp. RerS4]
MSSDRERVTNEIHSGLDALSMRQLETVASMVKSLRVPVRFLRGNGAGIVDESFAEEMSNLLSLHHSNHEAPLNKKPFEYAMKRCLIAQGHDEADLNPTPGESAYDVFGNGERWSLKTEAAKGLSPTQVKIEKFSEARWVRDATTAELCAAEIRERLPRHLDGYDRILMLRAETRADSFVYTLEEVPKKILLDCFTSATPEMFTKKDRGGKPGISFGADFLHPNNGDKAFRMLLDSSVEKVRLWFRTKYCIRHGSWVVSRPSADELTLFTPA